MDSQKMFLFTLQMEEDPFILQIKIKVNLNFYI